MTPIRVHIRDPETFKTLIENPSIVIRVFDVDTSFGMFSLELNLVDEKGIVYTHRSGETVGKENVYPGVFRKRIYIPILDMTVDWICNDSVKDDAVRLEKETNSETLEILREKFRELGFTEGWIEYPISVEVNTVE